MTHPRLVTEHRSREEIMCDTGLVAPRISLELAWKFQQFLKIEDFHIFDVLPKTHDLLAELFCSIFHEEQLELHDSVYVECVFENSSNSVIKLVKGEPCVNTIDVLCLAILEKFAAHPLGPDFGPWSMTVQVMHAPRGCHTNV